MKSDSRHRNMIRNKPTIPQSSDYYEDLCLSCKYRRRKSNKWVCFFNMKQEQRRLVCDAYVPKIPED